MESVVIIIKLCSKETNYEKKMKLIEQIGEKRMNKLLENNSPVFDQQIFKGDLKEASEILRKPLNGIHN
jgi:hypothetical protein